MTKKPYTKWLVGLGAILVALLVFFVLFQVNTSPKTEDSQLITIHIASGSTVNEVINNLESEEVIRSAFFTKLLLRFGEPVDVKAGNFVFDSSWSSAEVLTALRNPNYHLDDVVVQLPEVGWARHYARELSQHFDISAEEFLAAWNDIDYIRELREKFSVLPEEVLDPTDKKVLLEGFLYPDIYHFASDSDVAMITEKILENTQAKFEDLKKETEDASMSFYEILTLASIVEYEAGIREDMERVAGVFMNRLAINMRLESSATTCYALYEFDSWEECEQKQPDSPYNTYQNEGLTPGPVLNPTVKALEATIHYDHNDYYFFLADAYGDGTIYFQRTYEEHEIVRKRILGY